MSTTRPVHRIADKAPEFPCWLYPQTVWDGTKWTKGWSHTTNASGGTVIESGATHWSPDSPTPPPQQPGQEGANRVDAIWEAIYQSAIKVVYHARYAVPDLNGLEELDRALRKHEAAYAKAKSAHTAGMSGGEPKSEDKTCGELSCDECNERYERLKSECSRLQQALQRAERERDANKNRSDAWLQVASVFTGRVGMTFPESIIAEVSELRASLTSANERIAHLEKLLEGGPQK